MVDGRRQPAGYRFELAPLMAATEATTPAELAVQVGVSVKQVWRASQQGLSPDAADRWAVAVHLHPAAVWSDWWLSIEEAVGG